MTKVEVDALIKKLKIPSPWPVGFSIKPEGKRILKALVNKGLTTLEISKVLNKTINAIHAIYTHSRIKLPWPVLKALKWNSKMDEAMFDAYKKSAKYPRGSERNNFQWGALKKINTLRDRNTKKITTWHAVHLHMQSMPVGKKLVWGGGNNSNKQSREIDVEQIKAILKKEERSWPEPEVLEISEEVWHRQGIRRGYMSRFDYKGPGFRSGIILEECRKIVEEGCRFVGIVGGLTSKGYVKKELRRRFKGIKPHLRDSVTEHFVNEAAKELACVIPKIKKPVSVWVDPKIPEFLRFYISTSPIYDGPNSEYFESTYGEEIARRLQTRRSDIRVENEGSARLDVKDVDEIDWMISPVKNRLPSKFYSTGAEREIEDKSGQSEQLLPNRWIIGTQASAVHKTGGSKDMPHVGEKDRPYITVPASCRLDATTVAENQVGIVIVESINGNNFVRYWNFKDLIYQEKKFITGIKKGSLELHKRIVDVMKEHGAMTVGLLSDKLSVDRQIIEHEIKFLEEPKMLARETWPGLFYNQKSQRYDFHLDWLQEKLRHHLPREFVEDSFLFFGCLHAGYTTTDYEHFVKEYPEIIINHKVRNLVGLGDFIAGLKHSLMHRGEIMGALNNTDQEIFAAELIATVRFKAFKKLFEIELSKFTEKPSREELKSIISNPLILAVFDYIDGNHDSWQLMDGTTPLVTFHDKLQKILTREINALIVNHDLPAIDIDSLVEQKTFHLPDFKPICELISGSTLGCRHPGMARADTTSLRAQKALDAFGTQVVAIANFHVATTVRKWRSDLGQCVAIQAPTQVIYTPFEGSKMKKLDFGPVFLRTLSNNGRIYMDETAYFNKPMLERPYLKWTDVDKLKESLGLLRA